MFHNFTFEDVKNFVGFNLYENDVFIAGTSMYLQIRVVAIGGPGCFSGLLGYRWGMTGAITRTARANEHTHKATPNS